MALNTREYSDFCKIVFFGGFVRARCFEWSSMFQHFLSLFSMIVAKRGKRDGLRGTEASKPRVQHLLAKSICECVCFAAGQCTHVPRSEKTERNIYHKS